jgi:hypothetical protein
MDKATYKSLGIVSILISIAMFFIISANKNWFMVVVILAILILGILFLFFGSGKFQMNKLSNFSANLFTIGLLIGVIGPFLIRSAIVPYIGYAVILISLLLIIISIFKSQ